MHRWLSLLLPASLSLTACSSRPDFDRKYAEQQQELDARAAAMDAQIDSRLDVNSQAKQGVGKEPSGGK